MRVVFWSLKSELQNSLVANIVYSFIRFTHILFGRDLSQCQHIPKINQINGIPFKLSLSVIATWWTHGAMSLK
jgi:hypothetical protein